MCGQRIACKRRGDAPFLQPCWLQTLQTWVIRSEGKGFHTLRPLVLPRHYMLCFFVVSFFIFFFLKKEAFARYGSVISILGGWFKKVKSLRVVWAPFCFKNKSKQANKHAQTCEQVFSSLGWSFLLLMDGNVFFRWFSKRIRTNENYFWYISFRLFLQEIVKCLQNECTQDIICTVAWHLSNQICHF